MANDLNSCTIVGRLGRDPKLGVTGSGRAVCRFSIANNRVSEFGLETNWFNVSVFGDLAQTMARRLTKGQLVTVVGQVEVKRDLESGQSYNGIVAEDVQPTKSAPALNHPNALTISGRLGGEPEYKLVGKSNNRPMLTFSIANSQSNEYSERTTWLRVVVWGEEARRIEKLKLTKGSHLTVNGSLQSRSLGEGPERRNYLQLMATRLELNDQRNTKRNSGAGNGAESFSHFSQQTTFDRYTNELNPTESQIAAESGVWSNTRGWQVIDTKSGIYRGDPYPASNAGKQAAKQLATDLGRERGRPRDFVLKLVEIMTTG